MAASFSRNQYTDTNSLARCTRGSGAGVGGAGFAKTTEMSAMPKLCSTFSSDVAIHVHIRLVRINMHTQMHNSIQVAWHANVDLSIPAIEVCNSLFSVQHGITFRCNLVSIVLMRVGIPELR